jgi:alpha-aminoadipate carrier protein LysW
MSENDRSQTVTTVAPATAECPQCAANVAVRTDPRPGQIVSCGTCGAELEVLMVDPVQLGLAPEIEEDWGE